MTAVVAHLVQSGWSWAARDIAEDVIDERYNQLKKWGEQHHPDGTGFSYIDTHVDAVKRDNDYAAEHGGSNWAAILLEEIMESFDEKDEVKLRKELIQSAAVIFAWVEDIDSRKAVA